MINIHLKLYRWEKDGRDLEESDRITITGDGQRLTITQVEEGDASGYTCHASNIISSDSKAFELYVTGLTIYIIFRPPHVLISPTTD